MGARIGVGVTTYIRLKHLELCVKQIKKHTSDYTIYVANDSKERKGIAFRKNQCLKVLKDCDYIFLFDDDCFPIKEGWAEFFIEAHKASGQHHFMFLKETPTIKRIGTHIGQIESNQVLDTMKIKISANVIEIYEYNNCAGCFLFLTKEVIEKVGGYGQYPMPYGFEHSGFSQRIFNAGLTPLGAYTCPAGIEEYIYSMDYMFDKPFNKLVNHSPSISNEFHKLESYLKQNQEAYIKDIQIIYQPL